MNGAESRSGLSVMGTLIKHRSPDSQKQLDVSLRIDSRNPRSL